MDAENSDDDAAIDAAQALTGVPHPRDLLKREDAPVQTKQLALPQTGRYRKENQSSFSNA